MRREEVAEGSLVLRLALAGLASGTASGLIVAVELALLSPQAWGGAGFDPDMFFVMLAGGIVFGLLLASVPAFVAGAALWALQRRFATARRRAAWAAAGAGAGILAWVLVELSTAWSLGRSDPIGLSAPLLLVCLPAGAGAALAFRGTMLLTGELVSDSR